MDASGNWASWSPRQSRNIVRNAAFAPSWFGSGFAKSTLGRMTTLVFLLASTIPTWFVAYSPPFLTASPLHSAS